MLIRTLFAVIIFSSFSLANNLQAQNCCDIDDEVDLCYLSGADYCGSNTGFCFEYSLDGDWMINALYQKLTSLDNFGPDGIVDCNLELKKLTDVSSVQAINDCGCDIIFMPNVFVEPGTNVMNLDNTYIPDNVMQNIYDWSLECDNNLVIATQGEANLWGYTTTNSNVNPNTPVAGTSLNSIFEGPFGSLDLFNQGGTYQGVFTGTPSTDFEILSHDANGNPTAALDIFSNDIVVGDIGIFCSGGAGVVSPGPGINNNNDILICNIFALACQLAEEGNKVTVTHEICPGESIVLPDGQIVNTAGVYLDTLVAFNGCDSVITTALAYGIEESSIFDGSDHLICEGDTVEIDGTFPNNIPIPFFENQQDIVIDPSFVNFVSQIPIAGFGDTPLSAGMITSICIELEHNWLDDIDVLLIAPNGEILELTTDNGLNGDDYIQTCFTETAATTIGAVGSAPPYTGNWQPEGDWATIYGSPITGTWQLIVKDDANGFTGTLLNWSITFEPFLELSYHWETNVGLSCDDCPITDASPLESTTYHLTMTDSYGCTSVDSTYIEVEPLLPAPDVVCDSISLNSISISWADIPGADGYQINLNGTGWINPNNGNLGHALNSLLPLDTFEISVQALDDCPGVVTTLICSTPDCIAPQPTLDAVSSTSCNDSSDGSLSISATGGSGGYSFELNGETNASGSFSNLSGGSYEVFVIDDENCDNSIQVDIPSPDSMTLTPIIEEEISCFGIEDGALTVEISAGMAPFSFEWDNVLGDSILNNIGEGNYELLVTDGNGCTAIDILMIHEPTELTTATDSTWVICFGENNGTVTVAPDGGTLPYSYLWDNNANDQITPTANNLSAGVYEVTITDNNDCTITSDIQVEEPTELTLTVDFEDPNCFDAADGLVEITASGGTPNYNYNWNNPALPNDASISNLIANNYVVTVSDDNGCEAEEVIILTNPDPIELSFQKEDVKCFDGNDGSISVNVTGAIGSPIYTWDNGNGGPNNDDLIADDYCLTITDDNGCEAEDCITITQPPILQLSLNPERVSCDADDDGAIDLSIQGGTTPYNFAWSNSATSEDLSNLTVGNYSVTVMDGNDCEISGSTAVDESSPLFSLSFATNQPDCFGQSTGTIDLNINGAASNFTYQWSNAPIAQSGNQDLENIPAGTYDVLVEDEDGCEVAGSVALEQPSVLTADFSASDITCFGFQNGTVAIASNGGTTPHLHSIDGGETFQSSTVFSNLAEGVYDLVIQDANGCEYASNFFITEPNEIFIDVEPIANMVLGDSYTYNVHLNLLPSQIDTIIWTPADSLSCSHCLLVEANPNYTTNYNIQVITEEGCRAEAYTLLIVDRRISVYVPNVFSPNGDGKNDELMIFAKETNIRIIKSFQIFNRWGGHLFSAENFPANDPTYAWDGTFEGKELNSAVFTWFAEVELQDGNVVQLTGDVTLMR